MYGNVVIPRPLEIPRICPLPCFRSKGSAARSGRNQALACVVHENIQAAKMRIGLLHGTLYLFRVGYIELKRQGRLTKLLFQVCNVGKPAGRGSDLIATLQSSFGPDTPKAARSTGNQPCLSHFNLRLPGGSIVCTA
jgi:hypothetical protein